MGEKTTRKIRAKDEKSVPFYVLRGKLVVLSGPDKGKTLVLDQPELTIGSKDENHLILSDPTVSRKHAALTESAGVYVIRDLNSTNGTYLDGVLIREAVLEFGRTITLGETQIRFVPFQEKIEVYPSSKNAFGDVYGQSIQMRNIFGILEKVVPTDVTVILEGETGTGKELLARAIHTLSARSKGPFVVFDCGSIAENLVESELFGHEKGAFTGAIYSRQGVFEMAGGGTLFLDEIGELASDLQPKLLRVLETREVKRLGGSETRRVDFRLVAATHRNLALEVKEGRFREDLFYRLSVLRLRIAPLRERKEDIPLITQQLLRNLTVEYNTSTVPEVAHETLEILNSYEWPGNIRELRNVLSRALAMGGKTVIRPADLLLSQDSESYVEKMDSLIGKSLDEIERTAILQTLKAHQGNKTQTAKALGIAYSTLYEKIKKYGLP
ncbi:MAG: FHA domain-containing protein [Proteobacteria bacterium]|nr:FHA domain-containing protein [Pseudomonadota bacterium]NIS69095.1 FHA domain-containing protein [Pseudomonadota bacterium]